MSERPQIALGDDQQPETLIEPSPTDTLTTSGRLGAQHDVLLSPDHKPSTQSPGRDRVSISHGRHELEQSTTPASDKVKMNTPTTSSHALTPSANGTQQLTDTDRRHTASLEPITGFEPSWEELYQDRPIKPPVTPETMAELDSGRIFNNPKLRHDVNFDRELHFRPNSDGVKGKAKQEETDKYWKAVEWELQLIEASLLAQSRCQDNMLSLSQEQKTRALQLLSQKTKDSLKRIPAVFESVRDILLTLVPEGEQQHILARLDIELMEQQIAHGVLDLHDLASWLARVIKTHCAPMRDAKVDAFEAAVLQSGSSHELTCALAELVNIMEAMKLDVANHQIRHIRPFLISNTVDFQQKYNAQRVQQGKIDTSKAIKWLGAAERLWDDLPCNVTPLQALCSALLWDVISPQNDDPYAPTFHLDFVRLKDLSTDVDNMLMADLCNEIAGKEIPFYAIGMDLPNLAAEIARNPDYDVKEVQARLLRARLDHTTHWRDQQKALFEHLRPQYEAWVHRCINMTALELHNSLVPPPARRQHPAGTYGARLVPAQVTAPEDREYSLLRRLTHLTVLHWQVWAEPLYLRHFDVDFTPIQQSPLVHHAAVSDLSYDLGILDISSTTSTQTSTTASAST